MPDSDIPTVHPAGSSEPPRRPRYDYEPPRRSVIGSIFSWFMRTFFILSIIMNLLFLMLLFGGGSSGKLTERHHAGDKHAQNKVAIVRIEGLIMEGMTSYAHRQLKDAAQDENVKAIVIEINSPGGSVTASDNLYKAISDIREGKFEGQFGGKKKVFVSMGSVAASGGYYIAVPADKIYAQPTTMTGSIGVYAAFIDLEGLAKKYDVEMNIIKRGELKGGSMFKKMSEQERLEWEMMIESSYERFMTLVEQGRNPPNGEKRLKRGLREEFEVTVKNSTTGEEKKLTRRLADGGVFTAAQAKQYGLVDEIGYLDDAVAEAIKSTGLTNPNVIAYDRPVTLFDSLLGIKGGTPDDGELRLDRFPGTSARMWYLTPGYEMEGLRIPLKTLK